MTAPEQLVELASLQSPVLGDNAQLRAMQAEKPIWRVRTYSGDEGWLVIGHEEIRQLMVDRRVGRAHPDPDNAPVMVKNPVFDLIASRESEPGRAHDEHMRLRTLLTPLLGRKQMLDLELKVSSTVDDFVDRVLTLPQPVDLQKELSRPLSLQVLCELFGVPEPEWGVIEKLLDDLHHMDAGKLKVAEESLVGYLSDLAARKRAEPDECLISGLCSGGMPDDEVATTLLLLLFAGHESVAIQIASGVVRLLAEPELARVFTDQGTDRERDLAVEELLRTASYGGHVQPHYALEDVEIAGIAMKAGELILTDFAIANYDERVFEDPDRVDFTRNPNKHVTFAHGAWHCMGAPLARMELKTVYTALVRRIPAMRLATPLADLENQRGERLSSRLYELPLVW